MSRVRARQVSAKAAAVPDAGRWIGPLVLLCFVTSGAASLILETTLTRLLRLVLGNTTLAVTTVLCAFMGGLALGGYLGGRLAERTTRPLRAYAILEGAIGVTCLLLPLAVRALQPVYGWLYLHVEDSFLLLSLVRFTFCGLLLLVPACFMGATLPILSAWYAARTGRAGHAVAWLYTANSLGAAGGVLLCAFVLLPGLGLAGTIRLACMMGLTVCLVGLLLDRGSPAARAAAETHSRPEDSRPLRRSRLELALLLAYGLSGAAALVYEVAWTRVLSLLLGSSVYAFSLMLAAFILGLALGSAIVSRFIDRLRDAVTGFAVAEVGIALTALAAVPLFGRLPVTMVWIIRDYSHSFATLQAVEFALIVLIMIVPTTFMGAAFVLVSHACMSISGRVGRTVGGIYAANTIGAVVGAFTATFVWIPSIGTQNTILLASAANVAIGVLFLLPGLRALRWYWPALGLAGAACVAGATVGLPAWDPALMTAGSYLYADRYAPEEADSSDQIRQRMRWMRVLYNREDICGTVTVRDNDAGNRILAVGGKTDASRLGDLPTQLLLGHAPLLLHPQPRSALVIGLASGITLAAAASHDLERIDCVEISPAVVEASHYFDEDNGHVLSDPRVRLILGDGRNHVVLTDRTYDVIISEPSNPWMAGVADLFTIEYFQACRSRLNRGGLACVWLQAYQLEDPVFRSIIRTFSEVFPYTVVFEASSRADYLLVGGAEPIRISLDEMVRRFNRPAVAASLGRIDIHQPLDLLQQIMMTWPFDDITAGAFVHTDDSVMLEFAAPRSLHHQSEPSSIILDMHQSRRPDLPLLVFGPSQQAESDRVRQDLQRRFLARDLADDAVRAWQEESYDEANDTARKALAIEPAACSALLHNGRLMLQNARALQMQNHHAEAVKMAARATALAPHLAEGYLYRADLLTGSGQWAEAVQPLRQALAPLPENERVLNHLAWILATAPDDTVRKGVEAVELAERICLAGGRKNPLFLRTLAAAYAETGRFDDAVRTASAAADLAGQTGPADLAGQLHDQLAAYRQGRPFRQPAVQPAATK